MNTAYFANILFAQFSRWERLGDGLHRSRGRTDFSDLLPYLIFLAVAGIVVFAVMKYIQYNDFSKACDNPHKLFRELCTMHGLDRNKQRLLMQIANALGYVQPAEVFVRPSAFELNRLPVSLRAEETQIAELREQLF